METMQSTDTEETSTEPTPAGYRKYLRYLPDVLGACFAAWFATYTAPEGASGLAVGLAITAALLLVLCCRLTYETYKRLSLRLGATLAVIACAAALAVLGTVVSLAVPVCPGSEVAQRCTPDEAAMWGFSLTGSFAIVVVGVVVARITWGGLRLASAGARMFWRWEPGTKEAAAVEDAEARMKAQEDK